MSSIRSKAKAATPTHAVISHNTFHGPQMSAEHAQTIRAVASAAYENARAIALLAEAVKYDAPVINVEVMKP